MITRMWMVVMVAVAVASSAVAGPVTVRSWVTPMPGQTPFDPAPGNFAPVVTFDLPSWGEEKVAGFVPDERWARPDTPYTPGESRTGYQDYKFTYHAEVTDETSGESAVLSIDGEARANWLQRYDGLVMVDRLAVWFDLTPNWPVAHLGDRKFQLQIRETISNGDWVSTDVSLSAWPASVPEPGTFMLVVGGTAAAGVSEWLRKRRRGAVTSSSPARPQAR